MSTRRLTTAGLLCLATVAGGTAGRPAAAQPARPAARRGSAVLTGVVTEAGSRAPVGNAGVAIVDQSGDVVGGMQTTPDGRFRVAGLPAGTYELRVRAVGRSPYTTPLTLKEGEQRTFDVTLAQTGVNLQAVVVSASRRPEKITDAPADVQLAGPATIQSTAATSVANAAKTLAGVDAFQSGAFSQTIVARGFNAIFGGVPYLVDYRPGALPGAGIPSLHTMPQTSDDLARMELVLGPASALYGPNYNAGVLQVITKVEVRFNTELVGAVQDGGRAQVALRDVTADRCYDVTAPYLVGADGARSVVRELVGATMTGRYGLSSNYNIIFRAPGLAAAHAHGPAIMYWQVNGDVPSLIGPMDRDDVWFFMPTGVPEDVRPSDEESRALIARATGIDLPYEILSADRWVASRLLADKYREGPLFLVGDACHLHPPFGGYGMNMGVADGVDLGWKLAAVLQGWGGNALLDSYAAERRPVHEWVMDEAEANHAVLGNQLWVPGLDADTPEGEAARRALGGRITDAKAREFYTLGAVLGYCYGGSPVVVADGARSPAPDAVPPRDASRYEPSSAPGCLAPHAWLAEGVSLYDRFGPDFTLLAWAEGEDTAAAAREAAAFGVPLLVVLLPADVPSALYPEPLTLVRPDQHVCWRGAAWRDDVLARVTGRGS